MDNFNVASDKWMPVISLDGKFMYVSPIELFSGEYESFAGHEIQNYVMMLFCEAVVHSADGCQPADMSEWRELKSVFAERAVKYLESHLDLFWMRGDKPFLQDATLLRDDSVKYERIRLNENTPSNNGAILNTNQLASYTEWKDIVLDLIVHQTFSVVFGKSKAIPSRWCMYANSPNGNYNLYVTSDTVKNSIWMNLAYGVDFGRPVWETRLDSDVRSYVGGLIPLTVRVYISDDFKNMKYTKGLDYPNYGFNGSHLFLTKVGKEERPFGVFSNMQFWKEFNSIIKADDRDKPIQLRENRFRGIDYVAIHGLGITYKSSMGLYSTKSISTSMYAIKSPDKLGGDEYKKMYHACVNQSTKIFELISEALQYVNRKNMMFIPSIGKTYIKAMYWKYLDERSFELFEYSNVNDCANWDKVLLDACNHVLDQTGIRFGYLAQYKLSEGKQWKTLMSSLTAIK